MTETRLPSQSDFHNTLTAEDISDEDYIHAQTVWSHFKMTSFKEYHN